MKTLTIHHQTSFNVCREVKIELKSSQVGKPMIFKLKVHADVMGESFYKHNLITGLLCRTVVLKQKPLTHTTSVVSYLGHRKKIFSVKTLDLVVTYTYFFF
jgi:hypothetical protein